MKGFEGESAACVPDLGGAKIRSHSGYLFAAASAVIRTVCSGTLGGVWKWGENPITPPHRAQMTPLPVNAWWRAWLVGTGDAEGYDSVRLADQTQARGQGFAEDERLLRGVEFGNRLYHGDPFLRRLLFAQAYDDPVAHRGV